MHISFIETAVFTEVITQLVSDEEFQNLQTKLIQNAKKGDVIKGTRGARCVSEKAFVLRPAAKPHFFVALFRRNTPHYVCKARLEIRFLARARYTKPFSDTHLERLG